MHSPLISRQQDLEATATHQALMQNLGTPLLKSQAHANLLHSTLRQSSNDHTHAKAPTNVHSFIARSVKSDIDREAARKYGERMTALQRQRAKRGDSRQEAAQLRSMSDARANGGIEEEDGEEIGADGLPVKRGTKGAKGSFERLKKTLAATATDSFETLMKSLQTMYRPRASMAKAVGIEHGQSFEERYGIASAHVAQAVEVRAAVAKPPIESLSKSIKQVRERVDTALGITRMQRLNKTISTASAKLAKSLPTGVRGLRSAAPQYTVPQVEAAAGAALSHGAINAQSAQVIANSLALGGVGAVPRELMAKLRGE